MHKIRPLYRDYITIVIYTTADEADAYMFYRCFFLFLFFFVFFPSVKKYQTTRERIFMKLLPNDTGENGVSNVMPPPGE